MAKVKKALFGTTTVLAALVLALVAWVLLGWDKHYDDVPLPDLQVSSDPVVIARGEYLVRGPAHCSICHMGSVEEAIRSDGGENLPLQGGMTIGLGPLGEVYTANLTPDPETGIGRYSDGQIFRLLRHNVRPNGRSTLAPMMPFAGMADDDLVAVVSYLRTQPPVRHEVPPGQWTFMGKAIKTILRPAAFQPVLGNSPPAAAPAQAATVERGEYLANYVANCVGCHSPIDPATGKFQGPPFSGNAAGEPSEIDPSVILRMPNLTPDPTGVLVSFKTPEEWVERFRTGRVIDESIMPWGPFSRMTDEDLRAIYLYLNSLDPVQNQVGPTVEYQRK